MQTHINALTAVLPTIEKLYLDDADRLGESDPTTKESFRVLQVVKDALATPDNHPQPHALIKAAQSVIDNWERGDLARAVRELDQALQDTLTTMPTAITITNGLPDEPTEDDRGEFFRQITTQEEGRLVVVSSSDSLGIEGNSCLLQIGTLEGFVCAYLTDGQAQELRDALLAFLAIPAE